MTAVDDGRKYGGSIAGCTKHRGESKNFEKIVKSLVKDSERKQDEK